MRCPHCRESIPLLSKATTCPHCGRPLETDGGEKVRPIDLDYEALLADADSRSLLWCKRGAVFAFALAVVALVPVAGQAIAYIVLSVGQLVWAGFLVSRPYHRHFSPMRRLVTRWVRRLSIVFVALPLHTHVLLPVVGPFVGLAVSPALFYVTCRLVRAYARFHFVREKQRIPVTWAEKLLVVVLALLVLTGLCILGFVIYGLLSLGGGHGR